jgi:hypothetical protein
VVRFTPRSRAKIGLEQAKANNDAIAETAGDAPVLLLAKLDGIVSMDRQAREYSRRFADDHFAAVALLVGNSVSRAIASFFLGLNRPRTPTKAFTSEDDAVEWLLEHDVRKQGS